MYFSFHYGPHAARAINLRSRELWGVSVGSCLRDQVPLFSNWYEELQGPVTETLGIVGVGSGLLPISNLSPRGSAVICSIS